MHNITVNIPDMKDKKAENCIRELVVQINMALNDIYRKINEEGAKNNGR